MDHEAKELCEMYGLVQNGWLRSYREQQCVDQEGCPIPWYTYSAIHFIAGRLRPEMRVFEYGCGNSTLWYAQRVALVHSVDNDRTWAEKIGCRCPDNARVTYVDGTDAPYVEQLGASGLRYDLVAIDGRNRVACARYCVEHLSPGGVLVFDNAERPRYAAGFAYLAKRGFKRLDFSGVVPMVPDLEITAVLYRPDNVFDI